MFTIWLCVSATTMLVIWHLLGVLPDIYATYLTGTLKPPEWWFINIVVVGSGSFFLGLLVLAVLRIVHINVKRMRARYQFRRTHTTTKITVGTTRELPDNLYQEGL